MMRSAPKTADLEQRHDRAPRHSLQRLVASDSSIATKLKDSSRNDTRSGIWSGLRRREKHDEPISCGGKPLVTPLKELTVCWELGLNAIQLLWRFVG